jgi:hypothetical protein
MSGSAIPAISKPLTRVLRLSRQGDKRRARTLAPATIRPRPLGHGLGYANRENVAAQIADDPSGPSRAEGVSLLD